jgi:RNA polymerase sigma factor for flagellar operon FliA
LSSDQQRLVTEHAWLVDAVARQVFRGNPRLIDEHTDLGYIGLCKAALTFDPERGCTFKAYAGIRIAGAMRDGARTTTGRRRRREAPLSIDERVRAADESSITWGDVAVMQRHDEGSAEGVLGEIAARRSVLPEREQLVLTEYYENGKTLAEIGRMLGVTESRVSQIHSKAVTRLRQAIGTTVDRRRALERILAELDREPLSDPSGRAIRRLSRRTKFCADRCASVLRSLHEQGLVDREGAPGGRHFYRISITDRGRQHLAEITQRRAPAAVAA